MTALPGGASLVRRALRGHAAIGLLASALLYVICLTGSLAVLHDQWTRWEQPNVPEMTRLAPHAAQRALVAALARAPAAARPAFVALTLPTADLPRAAVTTADGNWYLDAGGRLAARRQDGWADFLVALHEDLHLPATWGLIVVGGFGVALVALAVTGVLAHPRIVRDAFALRLGHSPQVARVDWHNRLGVWTLPFAVAVAITGAFLGLGGVGANLLARADTGGQVERIYAPVFGAAPAPDPAAAPIANLAAALTTLARRVPGAVPTYATVRGPATRGQSIQIIAAHPRRLIYGEAYGFDAAGRWTGPAGMAGGEIGQQVAASTYGLHFGNYGGPMVEAAYLLLGLGLCVVIATGTAIWVQRRRARGLGGERLGACWTAVVWGVPLLLVWTLWVRVALGPAAPLAACFWCLLAGWVALAAVVPARATPPVMRAAALLCAAATGLAHLVLVSPAALGPVAIDLGAIALALPVMRTIAAGRATRRNPR